MAHAVMMRLRRCMTVLVNRRSLALSPGAKVSTRRFGRRSIARSAGTKVSENTNAKVIPSDESMPISRILTIGFATLPRKTPARL